MKRLLLAFVLVVSARAETFNQSFGSPIDASYTWSATAQHRVEGGQDQWKLTVTKQGHPVHGQLWTRWFSGGLILGQDMDSFSTDWLTPSGTDGTGPYLDMGLQVFNGSAWQFADPSTVRMYLNTQAETKKVNIGYTNDREFSVNWKLVDAANPETVIAGGVIAPGSSIAGVIELPAGVDAVNFLVSVDGVSFDGRNWVEDPEAKTEITAASNVSGTTSEPPVTSVSEPNGLPPAAPSNPTQTPPTSPQPPVWKAGTPSTADADRLDKATYKEGVDKLYVRLGEVAQTNKAVKDTLVANENTRKAENDAAKAEAKQVRDNMGADGNAAKSAAESSVSNQPVPGLGASAGSPGSGSGWSVPIGDTTVSLDPASESTIATGAGYMKTLITWCVLAFYAWWTWAEFRGFMQTAVLLQQAKGNPVAGGTGGQATSLIAAGLISAALLVIPAAFFALNPLGLTSLDTNPFTGAPGPFGMAGYLLYFFVPMGTILGVLAGMFVVRKGGLVILVGVAAVVRFIVP